MITRRKLTDSTGYSFRKVHSKKENEQRYAWFHIDTQNYDGVEVAWFDNDDVCSIYGEDGVCYAEVSEDSFETKLKNAIGYAQMAGGLTQHFEVANPPSFTQGQRMLNALEAIGELDADFTGSSDGVTAWLSDGFLFEYSGENDEFYLYNEGMNWVASTPEGLVKILEKARLEVERWEKVIEQHKEKVQSEIQSEIIQ